MNILFFRDFLLNFMSILTDLFNWFNTPIKIPILDVSIAPIGAMFGSGLVVLLGVIIVRAFL